MVNSQIVKLIQDTADSFTKSTGVNYKVKYKDYTCIIHDEVDYQFKADTPNLIEANVLFGSATRQNDLANRYSMSFVVNIQSEPNGWEIAKDLFDDIFQLLTRTYQQLGTYKSKIFFTSPVIMNPYAEIGDNFVCLMTMNGSVDFSENVVLGAKYELSLDGTNYVEIKPRQPYILKEATGGNDNNYTSPSMMVFTKQSNVLTINLVLIFEQKTGSTTDITRFNNLMNTLYNECYGASSQSYSFKTTTNNVAKTITNLICVRGQHIYDEASGENVLSLQFKVGA